MSLAARGTHQAKKPNFKKGSAIALQQIKSQFGDDISKLDIYEKAILKTNMGANVKRQRSANHVLRTHSPNPNPSKKHGLDIKKFQSNFEVKEQVDLEDLSNDEEEENKYDSLKKPKKD